MEKKISILSLLVAVVLGLITLIQSFVLSSYNISSAKKFCTDIQDLMQAEKVMLYKKTVESIGGNGIDYSNEIEIIRKFTDSPSFIILSDYLKNNYHGTEIDEFTKDQFALTLILMASNKDEDSLLLLCRRTLNALMSLEEKDYKKMIRIARKSKIYYPTRPIIHSSMDEYLPSEEDLETAITKNTGPFDAFIIWLYEEKHIQDSDIKLFYGVLNDDVDLVEQSLNEGANRHITDKEIYNRYEQYHTDFEKAQ